MPTLVFASSTDNAFPVELAIIMESFVSIHMSLFVIKPLSNLISRENSNKVFWILFILRAIFLILFDFFVAPSIAIFDFLMVFVGVFLIVPIFSAIKKQNPYINDKSMNDTTKNNLNSNELSQGDQGPFLNCVKCGYTLKSTDNFCSNCGTPFEGNKADSVSSKKVLVTSSNFDPVFDNNEDKLLEIFINKELSKAGISVNNKLIPIDVLRRKNILNVIFSILFFVYVSLIFFHFPIYTYILGAIILLIFFKMSRSYNFMKYLKKEIKARPSEKISNIVMTVKGSCVADNAKPLRIVSILIALILPMFIFLNPRIMYEKVDNGYAVRFYTFGLTNFQTVTIPETYNGEKVVSLRGNTFSNMPFLEVVMLPDTITEIRGQAFKNDFNLVSVNIPTNLEYLGGGAFYNCSSLTSIILPDTLTYMGGETFYGASSLEYIKLSSSLTEIRGDTFGNCTSLKSISIPDNVTRIGGHAFYGDIALSEVSFTKNSKLKEIGSSAFRKCTNLYSITIPRNVTFSDKTFKESPTRINYFYGDAK